jgi:hypothetical protein
LCQQGGQTVKITAVRRPTKREQEQIDDHDVRCAEQMRNELTNSHTAATAFNTQNLFAV